MTWLIAGGTAVLWAVVAFFGLENGAAVLAGFIPARASGLELPGAVPAALTPLSATLVHAGLLHLVFNMVMLLVTGRALEPLLGAGRLLLLYIAGAYLAAAAQWAVQPSSITPMVGASGAVSALVAGYALLYGRQRVRHRDPRIAKLLGVLWLAAGWIGIQLLFDWWAAAATGLNIATAAHVGGFIAGLLATPLLLPRARNARPWPTQGR